MLQRNSKVVAKVVKDTTAKTLRTEIYKTVKGGTVMNGVMEICPTSTAIRAFIEP